MKITRLSISNFLGLTNMEINAGKIVHAKGPNATGKTSIVKAIRAAFEGSKDPKVIHGGKDEAEVFVQLGDGTSIRRTFSAGGSQLIVKDGNGKPVGAPQKFLKKLVGGLAFNPVEFFELDRKERKQYLLKALPVEIDEETVGQWCGEVPPVNLDQHGLEVIIALEKHYYKARNEVHVVALDKEGGVKEIEKELPENYDADAARALNVQGLTEIITEQEAAEATKTERQAAVAGFKEDVAVKEAEIEQLLVRLNKAKQGSKEAEEKLAEAKKVVDTVKFPDPAKLKDAREKLEAYDKTKEVLSRYDEMKRLEEEASQLRLKHGNLDTLVKFLQQEAPKEILASLPPVAKGLKIEGDTMTLNDVPIDQLSTSEQIRFASEIARALSGELKLVCVDGIERLDPKVRKVFIDGCKQDKFQYVLTEVAGGEVKVTSK